MLLAGVMSAATAKLHQDLRDLVGHTFEGRYRMDALLGVGGMGAVFKGHHLGLHRDVAIKVLHPSIGRDPEISSRFDREAQSASRLDNPNCVAVMDYGTTEQGMKFMVMQLLEGGELTRLLGRPLPAVRVLQLTAQIVRGLEHAHSQGVVHRDIKPENVFVTRDHDGKEVLKLVDFGIAKIVDGQGDGRSTRAGLVFGTPAYMSPEQAAGGAVDERADLYSVGILMYEMLSGHAPFQSDEPATLVRMQITADAGPLPSDVPPMVAAIVQRLLAKSREDRFQSAKELRETIETTVAILGSDSHSMEIRLNASGETPSVSAPRVDPLVVTRPPVRAPKRRFIVGLGAAAIGLTTLWLMVPAEEQSAPQPSSTEEAAEGSVAPVAGDVLAPEPPRPDASLLAEIDRLLVLGAYDDADKLLASARDRFTKDAQLLWRHGRLLGKRKGKKAQALVAYADAIEGDPKLLDDKDFYAELYELLRNPTLRDDALDVALHQMGRYGHTFLLELVNNEKKPLAYDDRHRALDELARDPDNQAMINHRLRRELDLKQSKQSLTACKAYADALTSIASQPDYYFYPLIDKTPVPTPTAANREDAEVCAPLEPRRQELMAQLAALRPDDADVVVIEEDDQPAAAGAAPSDAAPAGAKKPAPKKKSECGKLRGIFKKKCW